MVDGKREGGMCGNVGKDEKEGSVSEPKGARTANTFPQSVQQGVGIRSV